MSRRSWVARFAALLIVAAALAGLGSEAWARAGTAVPPPPISACRGPAEHSLEPGAWWRREAVLDDAGGLVGWTLIVGRPGTSSRVLQLPAEASVSGPLGGLVVVSDSDARGSRIRLISTRDGCAQAVYETDAVVRRAVLRPTGDEVYAHLLRRSDRSDLGVWRVALREGRPAVPIAGPAADVRAIAALGPIWSTELGFDPVGARLAVQSCTPDGCATRVVDLASGDVTLAAGPGQGDLVALLGEQIVTWAACDGLPCPIVQVDLATGARTVLEPAAVAAAPLAGRSGWIAVAALDGRTVRTRLADPAGSAEARLAPATDGARPLAPGITAEAGIETPPDWLAVDGSGVSPGAVQPFGLPPTGEAIR